MIKEEQMLMSENREKNMLYEKGAKFVWRKALMALKRVELKGFADERILEKRIGACIRFSKAWKGGNCGSEIDTRWNAGTERFSEKCFFLFLSSKL